MKQEIKLTKDMSVYGTDDKKLGNVKQVVVDPMNAEVTHIVIEQGFIFTVDKVLPIQYIQRQEDGKLYIDRPADALDLRDYEATYYVNEVSGEVVDQDSIATETTFIPPTAYYYPPLIANDPGAYAWGMPGTVGNDPLTMVKRINVPEGSLVIPEGTNVYSLDDDHVGDVYSVHMDKQNNHLTHFIISQGLLFKDYKMIPTFWIEEVNQDGIHLAVSTEQLKALPAFEPDKA